MKILIFLISIFLVFQSVCISAVELRQNQGGDVLIFPFFNVENGWDSLITVSTSAEFSGRFFNRYAGIFKIRVRDSIDGKHVKSFTVYNSQIVNWRVSLSKNASATTTLRVAEGDCLITDTNEVLEGEGVEIELGVTIGIIEVFSIGRLAGTGTCTEFANNWKPGGRWDINPTDGVMINQPPKLNGELILVNVAQGLATSYPATALGDFTDTHLHRTPSIDFPTLSDASAVARLADGSTLIPQSGQGIDAVAQVLSLGNQSILRNDVILNDAIGARTDWVINYPLAGYKTYRPFAVEINGATRHCESFGKVPISGQPTAKVNSEVLENSLVSQGSRQQIGAQEILLDPPPPVDSRVDLCHAVNVLSFEDNSSILLPEGSEILSNLSNFTASPTSSLTWKLIEPIFPPESGIRRPVLAYSLTTFVNGTLDGGRVLANYAVLRPHRRE
jgi:hypothetical protein